jgi:hypothetical protein
MKKEKDIRSLKNELNLLQLNVTNMSTHGHGRLLRSFLQCRSLDEIFNLQDEIIEKIISLIPDQPRSPCPLCGSTPDNSVHGYKLDEGIRRHLNGRMGHQCFVIEAARKLASDALNDPYRIGVM